jgi:hypothetical protein
MARTGVPDARSPVLRAWVESGALSSASAVRVATPPLGTVDGVFDGMWMRFTYYALLLN